jgi:hypothetical protein
LFFQPCQAAYTPVWAERKEQCAGQKFQIPKGLNRGCTRMDTDKWLESRLQLHRAGSIGG